LKIMERLFLAPSKRAKNYPPPKDQLVNNFRFNG